MPSEAFPSYHPEAPHGLPPVTPPSGKFIAQLFLVPGLIVLVAVGCIWFVTWLVGGFYTPSQFLKDLRSGNAEVRWRRASDLAQVLKRDETLAANPAFALDLADLLRQALRENEKPERDFAERQRVPSASEVELAKALKQLQDERSFIEFLIPCLGNFVVPAGVPLLTDIAVQETGPDAATVALRRQLAVWALANAGENLKRYDRLPPDKQQTIVSQLEDETAAAAPQRSEWARQTLAYLQGRASGSPPSLGVESALERCARSDDPTLRKFTALALTFWEGSPADNTRMENTLVTLSRDDGHGPGEDNGVRGREVRYQATLALARRGSPRVAGRLPVLAEMLDEPYLKEQFHTTLKDGRSVADDATVTSVVTGALRAVSDLHRKQPKLDLASLDTPIDKLKQSDNPAVRAEAERALLALNRQ